MLDVLLKLESNLSNVKNAIAALNNRSVATHEDITLVLGEVLTSLYDLENLASLSQVSLDSVTGEESWMLSKIDESNALIVELLMAKHRAGLRKPSFVIRTAVTNERFTLESLNGGNGILRRDFSSHLDSWTELDILGTQENSFRIMKERVVFS